MKKPEFLRESVASEHFVLHYGWRDPRRAHWAGVHGVRDEETVRVCAEALESAFAFLLSPPMGLPKPNQPVPVYLLDVNTVFPQSPYPFTSEDLQRKPYIVIPCRTDSTHRRDEYDLVKAAAVHEAFHAVAWELHTLRSVLGARWLWFHEGCAVWTEMEVLKDVDQYLKFGMQWSDLPGQPIDFRRSYYQSGFFVNFLARKFGAAAIGDMWRSSSGGTETPWDAIQRVGAQPMDSLLTEYFRDAFFVHDPSSLAYAPNLAQRFNGREIHAVIDVSRGPARQLYGSLDHLACRYYLLRSATMPTLTPKSCDSPIRVELAPVGIGEWLAVVSNVGLSTSDDASRFTYDVSPTPHKTDS